MSFNYSIAQNTFNPYEKGLSFFILDRIEKKYYDIALFDAIYFEENSNIVDKISNKIQLNEKIIPIKIASDEIIKNRVVKHIFEISCIDFVDGKLMFSIICWNVDIISDEIKLIYNEDFHSLYELKYDCNNRVYYIVEIIE